MNQSVFFSVVVPTYNRAHLIPKTIESILNQTYTNFEIIIVDDGSTDHTKEIIQPYLSDKVFYYKKENAERSAARNFGTQKANGDYINWFDSDDLMFPDHLQEAALMIAKYNYPEIFAQGHMHQHISGKILKVYRYPKNININLYRGNPIANSPVLVRRDIALANPFNEDRALSGSEDYELWLRIASKYPIYASPKITLALVDHDERSMIAMSDADQLIKRFIKFITYTTSDQGVLKLLGPHKDYFLMKNHLLLAVALVNHDHLESAKKYLWTAFSKSPKIIFERGFYAFLKHYVKHSIS